MQSNQLDHSGRQSRRYMRQGTDRLGRVDFDAGFVDQTRRIVLDFSMSNFKPDYFIIWTRSAEKKKTKKSLKDTLAMR